MAWTFTEVFSKAVAGKFTQRIAATVDSKIWALTDEAHAVSGQAGRVYYSSNGTTWTEDTAWSGPIEAKWIFKHQGRLHLVGNDAAVGGRLYRRQDSTWVLVHTQADADLLYASGFSNDSWIIILGRDDSDPGGTVAAIWRWDGAAMTMEFQGSDPSVYPYDFVVLDCIYYNGEWYAIAGRYLAPVPPDEYVLRNRGDGTWPIFRTYAGTGTTLQLTDSIYGLIFGEELWHNGVWSNTNYPGLPWTAHISFGQPITARGGAGNYGKLYTYGGVSWTYRGRVAVGTYLYGGFAKFNGRLYCAGTTWVDPNFVGPKIWRINLYHDTVATYWPMPTARQLVCDHQYGDTIYFAVYNTSGRPIMMKIDDDLDEFSQLYDPSSGSFMQVQTALVRDVAYAYGYMGTDNQIQATVDSGGSFTDRDDDWGEDRITTMEYLPTAGSDLTITNYEDKDLLRTTTGINPWVKRGDIPGAPLSQLRDDDNIFVGCTAGSANLYLSPDIGQSYSVIGTGLPIDVDILDLELA